MPSVSAGGADGPALFVLCWLGHDGLPVADAVDEEVPEAVADASAGVPNEDTGGDFDHPSGEVAA